MLPSVLSVECIKVILHDQAKISDTRNIPPCEVAEKRRTHSANKGHAVRQEIRHGGVRLSLSDPRFLNV